MSASARPADAEARILPGLVSGDSHVIEPVDLWDGLLPDGYWGNEQATFSDRPGGYDPAARVGEMARDGVVAEVLYPSLALRLFGLDDAAAQQRCFRRYNEWMATFVQVAPTQLVGIGLVAAYRMEDAVAEAEWCRAHGLRGVQVWQTPHPDLPFSGDHYDPLWEACSQLDLPVSMHILSGHGYCKDVFERQALDIAAAGLSVYRNAVNLKLLAAADALLELLLSRALDRFPRLRVVFVENEISWLPFVIDQLDYYVDRLGKRAPTGIGRPPSDYLGRQVFATFFRDPNATTTIEGLGAGAFMWSNDYPHGNSTWPRSRDVIRAGLRSLGDVPLDQVLWRNAAQLYHLDLVPSGT